MDKINGYTKEEAEELARYISEGRRAGKTPACVIPDGAENTVR